MTVTQDDCPEVNHELIVSLQEVDDFTLWKIWQQNQDQARYLIAIFCRYFNLLNDSTMGLNNLNIIHQYFEQVWYFIFEKLARESLENYSNLAEMIVSSVSDFLTQEQIIINYSEDSRLYDENKRYIPLKYYLRKSLEELSPLERLVIVTEDKFGWKEEQIIDYLQKRQKNIVASELQGIYTKAYSRLINALPTDVVTIYLESSME